MEEAKKQNGNGKVELVKWAMNAGVGTLAAVGFFALYVGWLPSPLLDDAVQAKDHEEETSEMLKIYDRLLSFSGKFAGTRLRQSVSLRSAKSGRKESSDEH